MSNILIKKGEVLTINTEAFGGKSGVSKRFQWFFNNNPITNQQTKTLTITDIQLNNSGNYFCRVSQIINNEIKSQKDSILYRVLVVEMPTFSDFRVHNNNNSHNYSFRGIIFGNGNNISYKAKIEYSSNNINWIDYNSFTVINSQREIYNFNLLLNTITLIENRGYFRLIVTINEYNEIKSNIINLFVNVIPAFSQTIADNICYLFGETYNLGVSLEEGKGFPPFRYLWDFVADGRIIQINDTTTSNYNHTISLTINDTFFRWNQFIRCTVRDAGNYQFETFVLMPVVKIEKLVSNLNVLNFIGNQIDAYRVTIPIGYFNSSNNLGDFLRINLQYMNNSSIIYNETQNLINLFSISMDNQNQYFYSIIFRAKSHTNFQNLSSANNFRLIFIYERGPIPNNINYICTIQEAYNIPYLLVNPIGRLNQPELYNIILNRTSSTFTPTDIIGGFTDQTFRWFNSSNQLIGNSKTLALGSDFIPGRYFLEIITLGRSFRLEYFFYRLNITLDILPSINDSIVSNNNDYSEYICTSNTTFPKQFIIFSLSTQNINSPLTSREFKYTLQLYDGENFQDIETITRNESNSSLLFSYFLNPSEELFSIEPNFYRIKITYTAFSGEWISRVFKIKVDPPIVINSSLLPISMRNFYYLFNSSSLRTNYMLNLTGFFKFGSFPQTAVWKVISSEETILSPSRNINITQLNNIANKTFQTSLTLRAPVSNHSLNGIYRLSITDNEGKTNDIDTFRIMKIIYTSEITTNTNINRFRQYTEGISSLTFRYNLEIYGGTISQLRFQWQRFINNSWVDISGATQITYTINTPNTDYSLRLKILVINFTNNNTIFTDRIDVQKGQPITYSQETQYKYYTELGDQIETLPLPSIQLTGNNVSYNIVINRNNIRGGYGNFSYSWLLNDNIISNQNSLRLSGLIDKSLPQNIFKLRITDSLGTVKDLVILNYKKVNINILDNRFSNFQFNTLNLITLPFTISGLVTNNAIINIEVINKTNNNLIISKNTNNTIISETELESLYNSYIINSIDNSSSNVKLYLTINDNLFGINRFEICSQSTKFRPFKVDFFNTFPTFISSTNFIILLKYIYFSNNQKIFKNNQYSKINSRTLRILNSTSLMNYFYMNNEKTGYTLVNNLIGNFSFVIYNLESFNVKIYRNNLTIFDSIYNNGEFTKNNINSFYSFNFDINKRLINNTFFQTDYVIYFFGINVPIIQNIYDINYFNSEYFFGNFRIDIIYNNTLISTKEWVNSNLTLPNIEFPINIKEGNEVVSYLAKDIVFGPLPNIENAIFQLCYVKNNYSEFDLINSDPIINNITLDQDRNFKISFQTLESLSQITEPIFLYIRAISDRDTILGISQIPTTNLFYKIRPLSFYRKMYYNITLRPQWINQNIVITSNESKVLGELAYTGDANNIFTLNSFNNIMLPNLRNSENNYLIIATSLYLYGITSLYPENFNRISYKLFLDNEQIIIAENQILPILGQRISYDKFFRINLNNITSNSTLYLEVNFSHSELNTVRYKLLEINKLNIISTLEQLIPHHNFDSIELDNSSNIFNTISINLDYRENNLRNFTISNSLTYTIINNGVEETLTSPITFEYAYGVRTNTIGKEPLSIITLDHNNSVCQRYGIRYFDLFDTNHYKFPPMPLAEAKVASGQRTIRNNIKLRIINDVKVWNLGENGNFATQWAFNEFIGRFTRPMRYNTLPVVDWYQEIEYVNNIQAINDILTISNNSRTFTFQLNEIVWENCQPKNCMDKFQFVYRKEWTPINIGSATGYLGQTIDIISTAGILGPFSSSNVKVIPGVKVPNLFLTGGWDNYKINNNTLKIDNSTVYFDSSKASRGDDFGYLRFKVGELFYININLTSTNDEFDD